MDLTGLRRKYAVLVVLRSRREELDSVGRAGFSEEEGLARREAFRELAAEFPGALRELDTTPAESLQARLDEIDAAVAAEAAPAPRWMIVTIDFHHTLREILALKAWLANGGGDGAA